MRVSNGTFDSIVNIRRVYENIGHLVFINHSKLPRH